MKAVVQHSMTKAVFDALLKNDNLMTPIAALASNYAEKASSCGNEEEKLTATSKRTRKVTPSLPNSGSSSDDDIPSENKKFDAYVVIRRKEKIQVCHCRVKKFRTVVFVWRVHTLF